MRSTRIWQYIIASLALVVCCTTAGAQTLGGRNAVPLAPVPRPEAAHGNRGTPHDPTLRIPILEYHVIADSDSRWGRSWQHFRRDLELLYRRGYRPITVSQLVDGDFDIAPGMSPVVITFDDASPGQFRYIERDGRLVIDSTSAVGIWLAFHAEHPDWKDRATFCLLPAAAAGHAFFGEKGIQGQKTAWRFPKVRFLAEQGFELCGHTLWHAELDKYGDAVVQEQIARGVMAIDSAVPGYRVRTFALPLGLWPRNRALARAGAWSDPATGKVVRYSFDAILEVAGGPERVPGDPAFDPYRLHRIQVYDGELEPILDMLDRTATRYVVRAPR
jgi:peptidoglycan/xylan/chitin deacetylase (PgdA/CDA1 family)